MNSGHCWIFGYGSLIWRTGFEYRDSRPAYIHGWARRFWQGSTDHRGVPGAPGRVVTLIEQDDAICWGMAYCIDEHSRAKIMAQLDHREQGGYQQLQIPVYLDDQQVVTGITYYATADNPNYLGESTPEGIAEQVVASTGPSGPNTEYVLRLDQALTKLGKKDPHVQAIAASVKLQKL